MVRMTMQEYAALNRGDLPPQVETPAARQLRREVAREKRERLEVMLLSQIRAARLPKPERNLRIKGTSKGWRYDLVYKRARLVIEVMGLLYGAGERGGHQTPAGYQRDTVKAAEAVVLGWRYLAVTREQIEDGRAIFWIETLLRKGKR